MADPAVDVLAVNEAFYDAFAAGDVSAMEHIWAREADVTCLHPGWEPLYGRDAVLQSWRNIVASADRPSIECIGARASTVGTVATVICYEALKGGYLIATNIFVREGNAWRMAHHHASGPVPPPAN